MKFSTEHLLGSWTLSEKTLLSLAEVDGDRIETRIHPNLEKLVNQVNKADYEKKCFQTEGLNDYLRPSEVIQFYKVKTSIGKRVSSLINIFEEPLESCMEDSDVVLPIEDDETIIKNLILYIQENGNFSKIGSALNCLEIERLNRIVYTAWHRLTKLEEQRSFIIHISSLNSPANVFHKEILFPLMKEEETFNSTFDLLKPIIFRLGKTFIETIVMPLANNENSIFNKDILAFTQFFMCLSEEQKYECISLFDAEDNKLQNWQLIILNVMVENACLTEDLLFKLVKYLKISISEHNSDRSVGKILFRMVSALNERSPVSLIEEIVAVNKQFKGIMRFRIKKQLDQMNATK